jgi:hypothetical protein
MLKISWFRTARMMTVFLVLASLILVGTVLPLRAEPSLKIAIHGFTVGSGQAGNGSLHFHASFSNSTLLGSGAFDGILNGIDVAGTFSIDSFALPVGQTFFCGQLQTVVLNGAVTSGNFTSQDVQVTGCAGDGTPVMILIAPPCSTLCFFESYFGFGRGTTTLHQ